MINCVVIDDELQNITILTKLIGLYCTDVQVVGQAGNANDALQVIRQLQPQLVFLDVEMPGMDAFDLLNVLKPISFELVLVTAYEKYALKAFNYNALHYLLKPIDIEELQKAVQKATARIQEKNITERLQEIAVNLQPNQLARIALPTRDGLLFYAIDDIICLTAKNNYTIFEFVREKELLVTGTLKDFEDVLPTRIFCRVHNSHLINMNHIKKYYKGKGGRVEMTNGHMIEVSLRRRDEFLSRLR